MYSGGDGINAELYENTASYHHGYHYEFVGCPGRNTNTNPNGDSDAARQHRCRQQPRLSFLMFVWMAAGKFRLTAAPLLDTELLL